MFEYVNVGDGHRQVVLTTKGDDPILQRRASRYRCSRLLDEAANPCEGTATWTAGANLFELVHVEQMKAVGLLGCTLKTLLVNHFGEIEKGASERGRRNTVDRTAVDLMYSSFVDDQPRPTPTRRRSHFNRMSPRMYQAPERSGASVTEKRILTAGEYRGEPISSQTKTRITK